MSIDVVAALAQPSAVVAAVSIDISTTVAALARSKVAPLLWL